MNCNSCENALAVEKNGEYTDYECSECEFTLFSDPIDFIQIKLKNKYKFALRQKNYIIITDLDDNYIIKFDDFEKFNYLIKSIKLETIYEDCENILDKILSLKEFL